MTVYLFANIGNSDLYVPREHLPEPNMQSRGLGEEVKAKFESFRPHIRLPLIKPAITYICQAEKCEVRDIHFYLFTSDQNPALVGEDSWQKDTHPVGEVIQRYLAETANVPKKQTRLIPIKGNPADYVNAFKFHRGKLVRIKAAEKMTKQDKVYLEISGGTPAMTAMLIAMGVDVFGTQTTTLYVDRGSEEATPVPIADALLSIKMRDLIREQIRLYAYKAARETLSSSGKWVTDSESTRMLLNSLLNYADRRLAFDMDGAREALAATSSSGELQAQITFWKREFTSADIAKNIEEVIYSAKIKQDQGEYADFTQRLFRFQEAILQYMAESQGLVYAGDSRKFAKPEWIAEQPDLAAFLKEYRRNVRGEMTSSAQEVDVSPNRTLNRFSFGAIVDYFVQTPQWAHWRPAAEGIFRLSKVADLRNKGLAGHGFEGISEKDIEDAYKAPPAQVVEDMQSIYQQVFNREPAESPYDILNRYIDQLLKDSE
jgi:hypothetical protein